MGNFGRYQCPNEGQARIAEYLDLAKGKSMRKTGQNHSHPFFDPLYGAPKTDPFQNGPIMSRGTNGMIFGIPGPVVKKYQQKLKGGLEPLLITFQKITD